MFIINNETLKLSGLGDWLNQINDESRKSEILTNIHSEHFTDFYGRKLGVYKFQQGLGICGILLPSGHFLKCHDQQHSLIANLLNKTEKFLSVYFSSRLIFDEDESVFSLHIDNNGEKDSFNRELALYNLQLDCEMSELDGKILITQAQIDFIRQQYHYMNQSQKKMLSIKYLKMRNASNTFSQDLLADNIFVLNS